MFAKAEIRELFPIDQLDHLVDRVVEAKHLPVSTRTEVLRDIEAAAQDIDGLCRDGVEKLQREARGDNRLELSCDLEKPVTFGEPTNNEVSRFDGEGGVLQP